MENLDAETKKDGLEIIRDIPKMSRKFMMNIQMLGLTPMIMREEFKAKDPVAFSTAQGALRNFPGELRAQADMFDRMLGMMDE